MEFSPIITEVLDESQLEFLEYRFLSIFDSKELWEEIKLKYSTSSRSYHNLSHIFSMLDLLDKSKKQCNNKLLETAVFFHDVIYDSRRKDNELKSAEFFLEKKKDVFLEKEREKIYDLILSTEKHSPIKEENDFYFLLDLDLNVLGAEKSTYKKYTEAIRKEYAWVPGLLYKRGRKKVLESFLKREKIYFTDFFYSQFEEIARENLNWEFNQL